MSWQILLGISIVTYVASQLLQRAILRENETDPFAFAVVFQLFVGILIGAYALLRGFSLPNNFIELIPNLILMTFLYVGGNIALYRSIKLIPISEFSIVFSTSTPWTILGAVVLLQESFTREHLMGTVLVMTSLLIVFKTKERLALGKGHLYGLIAAALFGLAFVNDALILKTFEVNSYVSLAFIFPGLALFVMRPQAKKAIFNLIKPNKLRKLFVVVSLYALSAVAIFTAYAVGNNAAVISVINKSSSILIVLAGVVSLDERSNVVRKIVGALIATLGVILLIV